MQEKRQNLSARVSFAFFSAFFCYVRGLLFLIRGRWEPYLHRACSESYYLDLVGSGLGLGPEKVLRKILYNLVYDPISVVRYGLFRLVVHTFLCGYFQHISASGLVGQ